MNQAETRVYEILNELLPENDFHASDDYIDDGLLDSFDMVLLIGELENAFDVKIDPLDILPQNFVSARAITALLSKYENNF